MDAETSPTAIQSQVLRTTLAEITSARATAATDSEQQPAPDCCVICLEELSEPSTAQPCGHAHFDFICLTNWLAVDPKCPLCKASVLKVRYTDRTGPKTYSVQQKASTTAPSTASTPSSASRTAQTTFQHYFLNRNSNPRRRHTRPNPAPAPSPSSALPRRRQIYTQNLYSLHVGANPLSRYRSGPTPSDFTSDAALLSRARTFIRRELQVFSFLSDPQPSTSSSATETTSSARRANNAEFLLEYTVAILKTVDMQGAAGQAEGMLADFLGRDSARLFLHELRAWLRSPCLSLAAWDREVQYPDPDPEAGSRKRGRDEDGGEGRERGSRARRREGEERGRERGKGDYWRPGYRRYAGKRRRGDERRVEVGG